MDAATFRKLGHELIEWVADYRERVERLPVMSPAKPGEIRARFPAEPPRAGGQLAAALKRLDEEVVRGITHWNHPSFFAYFPGNTSYASILADIVAPGLGAQGMSWQTSPAATEVEEVMMDWLRQMVGLSDAWTGVVHDTASTATLCALLCAREKGSSFSQNRGGLQALDAPLVVYASSQAHSSIEKAALLAGFGKEHLRLIETDDAHALRDQLEAATLQTRPGAVRAGRRSETGTTAIDPLAAMAPSRRRTASGSTWTRRLGACDGAAGVPAAWDGVESAGQPGLQPAQGSMARLLRVRVRQRPAAPDPRG